MQSRSAWIDGVHYVAYFLTDEESKDVCDSVTYAGAAALQIKVFLGPDQNAEKRYR